MRSTVDEGTFVAPSSILPRRSVGGLRESRPDSARAVLLVLFGEYVWPSGGSVWSAMLLDVMADLGFEEAASRRALQRLSSQGLIDNIRQGRQVQWVVTEAGNDFFVEGRDRVLQWQPQVPDWDGEWLFLTVTVPDGQRRLRRPLNSALEWAGLGQTASGLWITPHPDRADEVRAILASLGLTEHATTIRGRCGPLGSADDLVAQAWDLEALADTYADFIAAMPSAAISEPRTAWIERLHLVSGWRRFPFLDPRLPEVHLPAGWIGFTAERLYRERRADLHEAAWSHWRARERAIDPRP